MIWHYRYYRRHGHGRRRNCFWLAFKMQWERQIRPKLFPEQYRVCPQCNGKGWHEEKHTKRRKDGLVVWDNDRSPKKVGCGWCWGAGHKLNIIPWGHKFAARFARLRRGLKTTWRESFGKDRVYK